MSAGAWCVRRGTDALLAATVGIFVLATAAWLAGLRVNLTGSIPVGVYRVVPSDTAVTRGTIVLACLPPTVAAFARSRGYVPSGGGECAGGTLPVGKVVVAVAGDTVTLSADGVTVNGVRIPASGPLARDSRGRLLPQLAPWHHVVGQAEIWLASQSSRGFDSRYFGPISTHSVRERVVELRVALRVTSSQLCYLLCRSTGTMSYPKRLARP